MSEPASPPTDDQERPVSASVDDHDPAQPTADSAADAADSGAELAPAPAPAGLTEAATALAAVPGLRTLAVDIGGTGIKTLLLDEGGKALGDRQRVSTPRPATPPAVLDALSTILPVEAYERVAVGFPGVVVDGVIRTAPNLDPTWEGFDLQAALTERTGKPTRVLNDAGVQGFGVIEGRGVEMLITLGTGMGHALYLDGKYVPNIELAHHPLRKGLTYEEYINNAARKHLGSKKWNRRVRRVIAQILAVFNPRVLYVGGGNSRHLKGELPPQVRRTDNVAGLLGGVALWK